MVNQIAIDNIIVKIFGTFYIWSIPHPIEWQYEKSLKKCSLIEVVHGIVNAALVLNWFDSVNCVDNGDYYLLKIFHSAGINNSIINKAFFENLFEEYGAKIRVEISENSLFIQIFKYIE